MAPLSQLLRPDLSDADRTDYKDFCHFEPIVKNKVAPPFRSTTVEVLYGEGISRLGEVLDYSVDKELIKKSGSFYSYNGERIGQGRDNVKAWLKANPEVVKELEEKIWEVLLKDPTSLAEEPVETSDDEDDDDAKEFELDKESSSEPSSEQNNESFDEFVNGVEKEAAS